MADTCFAYEKTET